MMQKFLVWIAKNIILRTYNMITSWALAPILVHEWRKSQKRHPNERPLEYAYAMKWLAEIYPQEVLDVGSGRSAWPHIMANCYFRVSAIDKVSGYWIGGCFNRHWRIFSDDITNPRTKKRFDAITCLSVLEHIADHEAAVRGMFELLKPDGHLILSVPYNPTTYVEDVYRLPEAGYGKDYPYVCQVFSRKHIESWLTKNDCCLVDQEFYEIFSGEFWTFGERIYPPRKVGKDQKCHLTCLVLRKNG
jgi:SAM-dependent methyltransferase